MNAHLYPDVEYSLAPPVDMMACLLGELTSRTEDDFVSACAAVEVARKLAQDSATVALLGELGERLEALAAIQRALRLPSVPVIDLGEALRDLCAHMVDARFAYRGIFLRVRMDVIPMDGRKAWAILVIISELLLHAHRRAFRDGAGLISVDARAQAGVVTCRFQDDGTATKSLETEELRFGRSTLASVAQEVGGSLDHAECPRGTVVTVRVPLAQKVEPTLSTRFRAAFSRSRAVP